MNIFAIAALCVGVIVGGLLGRFWSKTSRTAIKSALAVFGVLFTGAPVAFLSDLGVERWFYPVGATIGILWYLVGADLRKVSQGQRQAGKAAWRVALTKVLAVATFTLIMATMAFVHTSIVNGSKGSLNLAKTSPLVMPCRLVWIYLGRYSNARQQYVAAPAFHYKDQSSMRGPIPQLDDRIVLTEVRNLIVPGFKGAEASKKCNRMLEPPANYRPETASDFIAGRALPGHEFLINDLVYLPDRGAEPTYVWASVRVP